MANARLVKSKMHELASQAYILATGLQNVAPPGPPGKSVQYLLDTAEHLENVSKTIDRLLAPGSTESKT